MTKVDKVLDQIKADPKLAPYATIGALDALFVVLDLDIAFARRSKKHLSIKTTQDLIKRAQQILEAYHETRKL